MPWIKKEMCTGCRLCVDECPAGAIAIVEESAQIDDGTCIRCGVCHGVCPNDAVRHDGERVPDAVESNLNWVRGLWSHEYYASEPERRVALRKRLERHFAKKAEVARKTIEALPSAGEG